MKRIFITLFLLLTLEYTCYPGYLSPRRCAYDSLLLLQGSSSATNAQKIIANLNLAKLLMDSVPERSFFCAIEAYKLSVKENNLAGKARSRIIMGTYYTYKQRYDRALSNFLGSLRLFSSIHDTLGQIELLAKIGALHQYIKKYQSAEIYFKEALILAQKKRDGRLCAQYLELLAIDNQLEKDYDTAMILFNQAYAQYALLKDTLGMMSVSNNIGSVEMDRGEYKAALERYLHILAMLKKPESWFLGTIYTRIGHCYSEIGNYRKSLEYNFKALNIRIQSRLQGGINSSIINIAGDYYMLNKPDSGKIFMENGLKLARFYGRLSLIENAYRRLSQYYYRKQDYVKALEYDEKKFAMLDSIMMTNNRYSLELVEANQRYAGFVETNAFLAKQNEKQLLNIRKQSIQFTFVEVLSALAAIVVLIVVIQFIYNRAVRRKMQHLNEKLNLEMWERKETQKQTRIREEQFRFVMENSLDMISRLGKDFMHTFASPSSLSLFGYTAEEMLGRSLFDVTHPEFHDFTRQKVEEMIHTRSSLELVYQARKKDGSYTWVETVINPIFDHHDGTYREFVSVTRDIQDRKSKEIEIMEGTKQKENLLKEIHHRVKNNFAILVSLINMQKEQTRNPELVQSLTNLQLRIRSMALVHEMLYRSSDFEKISFTEYLRSLASVIAGTFNRRDIQLHIEANESVMSIETSIPLGLIVNEILSNAYKHAFPEGNSGNISIHLINPPESSALTLVFSDDGMGLHAGFDIDNCKTMGLQIVNILVHQIEGTLTITNNPGACFTISFPKVVS